MYMILRFLQAHRGCHTLRLDRILTSLTHWQVSEVGVKLKQGSSGTTKACSWWRFVFWTYTELLIHPKVSNVTATEMKWASQLTQRRTPWELRQWRLLRKTVTSHRNEMGITTHTASHTMEITAVAALAKNCYLTESFTHGNNKLLNTTIKTGDWLQLKG
jgi:hypothetical protein